MTTYADGATVTHDLYKDIHKAIRAELFSLIVTAGALDPEDGAGRAALAERLGEAVQLLVSHAEHEDEHLQDAILRHVPLLGQRVESEHVVLDGRMLELGDLAAAAADAADGERARRRLHALYLELASFTSAYLAHIDMEERQIMPALSAAMPVSDLLGLHDRIVGSIPPPEMARALALMLPAINGADRADMLGGMRATAPAEAFTGVVGLARSVLQPADFDVLAARLALVPQA